MKFESIDAYNQAQSDEDRLICEKLYKAINSGLAKAESKIWHGHPVWFLAGNPIVGYSKLKTSVSLMFRSGVDFDEPKLAPGSGKFKDASIRYTSAKEVDITDLERWFSKSKTIQWDYKNIVKRKGKLVRLV